MSYKSILNVVVVAVVVMAVMFVGCGGKKEKEASGSAKSGDSKSQVEKVKSGEKAGKGKKAGKSAKFTDSRDGKTYKTVKIGKAVWMAENLNFAAEGSKCYGNEDANCEKYGRMYNWETAKKACPAGFHLPSDDEWTALTDAVGGLDSAGTKLKSTSGWNSYYYEYERSGNGTDDYGWSALPGGTGEDSFFNVGRHGHWWSASELYVSVAWLRGIEEGRSMKRYGLGKTYLMSVRCVQDN